MNHDSSWFIMNSRDSSPSQTYHVKHAPTSPRLGIRAGEGSDDLPSDEELMPRPRKSWPNHMKSAKFWNSSSKLIHVDTQKLQEWTCSQILPSSSCDSWCPESFAAFHCETQSGSKYGPYVAAVADMPGERVRRYNAWNCAELSTRSCGTHPDDRSHDRSYMVVP